MTISVDQSIALHQRRQSAELAMLRQIASAPKWLGAVAREQGIMPDHFGDPDTRILAAALLEPGEWTVAQRLRVAAEMLRRDHLWDDAAFEDAGAMRWGCRSLAAFALAVRGDRDAVIGLAVALHTLRTLCREGGAA